MYNYSHHSTTRIRFAKEIVKNCIENPAQNSIIRFNWIHRQKRNCQIRASFFFHFFIRLACCIVASCRSNLLSFSRTYTHTDSLSLYLYLLVALAITFSFLRPLSTLTECVLYRYFSLICTMA